MLPGVLSFPLQGCRLSARVVAAVPVLVQFLVSPWPPTQSATDPFPPAVDTSLIAASQKLLHLTYTYTVIMGLELYLTIRT